MKNANLSAYFSILKFAYRRDSSMGKTMHTTLLLIMLAGLLFAWKFPDYAPTGHLLSMVAFAGFFIGYWLVFCIGFLLQNSPANACTVPQLHLKIQHLAILLCLLISFIFSVVSGYLLGHFTLIFAISIATLASFWVYNAYYYALFIVVVGSIKWWLPIALQNEGDMLFTSAILTTACAYAWLCLRSSFPAGGDRHIKIFKLLGHLLQQATPNDNANTSWQKLDRLQAIFAYFYRRELHTITSAKSTKSPIQLLGIGLGPGMHWGADIFLLGMTALYSTPLIFTDTKQDSEFFIGFLLLLIPIASSATFALSCLAQLYKTRREQALLCLTPIAPQANLRNHIFRNILLRRFVQSWLMSSLCVSLLLLAGFAFELTGFATWIVAWMMSPLFFAYVLQDYSALDAAPNNGLGVVAVASFVIAVCFSLKWGEGSLLYTTVSGLALLVGWATYRGVQAWRKMLTHTFQMPVGHRR